MHHRQFTPLSWNCLEHEIEEEQLAEAIRLSLRPNDAGSGDGDEQLEEAIRLSLQREGNLDADEQTSQSAIRLPYNDINDVQFRYTPLQNPGDFRIMCLDWSKNSKRCFEFEMIPANLDSSSLPPYTALSYAWGEKYTDGSHLTDTISCGGKILRVTGTLHQALRRIWETEKENDPDRLVLLWVDAICINEDDVEERQNQVARMADIFTRCTRMIIWLGEHSKTALEWIARLERLEEYPTPKELATSGPPAIPRLHWDLNQDLVYIQAELLDLLRTLCVEMPHSNRLRQFLGVLRSRRFLEPAFSVSECHSYAKSRPNDGREALSLKRSEIDSGPYNELSKRPWFRRKWVIQEVARSCGKTQIVLIADKVIPLEEVVEGLRQHSLLEPVPAVGATAHNATLLGNLARYRITLSSNPHDHIYALVGISNDCSWVSIDYTLDASELYTHVAIYYITNGNVIAVLAVATVKRSTRGLPSWIPDWREESEYSRCAAHADALDTLAIQAEKLFESNRSNRGNVKMHFGDTRRLDLKAWIIQGCANSDVHDHNACMKCLLLYQALDLASPVTTASSRPLSKGKAPASAHRVSPGKQDLHAMRQAQARAKWGVIIREQFEEVMHPEEVLCLLQDSPFGFVLWPTDDGHSSGDLKKFSLGYCFQVDEEGWSSEWFSNILGEDGLEWISLI